MGFSVSGSAAILFIAAFVSVGILYSAAFNGFERVQDANNARNDRVLTAKNTVVEVANTTYDSVNDTVTVNATNNGSTTLSVSQTDVLVDGEYVTDSAYVSSSVAGNSQTDLWLPGETYSVTVPTGSAPTRVKVVTGTGVTATEVV
ncbi:MULTISPECIES: fla cluster protein FlaF [Halobacterium]|uniref:Arl cluster protein ArlF n=1 Tax=Halobacterium salinarum (strain ATCC 33171 / DSM 3754 / JCM 8978 / NBRC 102687 / NCIMB 764 / 91-R6) TaxID=2597657 RepID=A0A4D6GSS0_HALS9|nr:MULTISPECIES: fla cluster protein FlaF [Halobacterium]MCF2166474.1 fla cluster protein FlaF [Halobacterium salinarum]MCF2168361.1 fla cluster protein FlaF [Halobacterium salinarum]MCF2206673.1 fla cluster protein FlaF [Halobacterium salinarum]MCF2238561.1 fla cluster protein FlaF [Halobacterium salinarum]MCF2240997.1 fla cluster protein FlaF [Halobacterium salinarum]